MKRQHRLDNGTMQITTCIKVLSRFFLYIFTLFSQPDALRRGYNRNNLS